jgi:DNA-binding beta-propeller fold protein YncE
MSPLLCARRPAGDTGSSGRARAFSLGALSLFAGLILLLPASASAVPEHPFLGNLGTAEEPTFAKAEGMAIDQSTGDLLVIDAGTGPGTGSVSRWHSDGTPADFSALGTNVIDGSDTPEGGLSFGGPGEVQIAVDHSGTATDGRIYIPQFEGVPDVVDIFASDGSFLGQLSESSEGEFGEPCGIAVDPDGNLYVGDFSGAIHKFANPPVEGDSTDLPFSQNCTLAAGAGPTDGYIFPTHFFNGRVAKLDSASGAQRYEFPLGETPIVTVDPTSGHLYAASGSEVREFDASGESEAIPLTPIPGETRVTGVAVDGIGGYIYISRNGNPHIEVYGPPTELPEAITEAATLADGTITLHGTIDAAEGPPATCVFQYVESDQFKLDGFDQATQLPCDPAGPFLTGEGPVSVSAEIAGLPEAGYSFRLLATNEDGGTKAGETLFFSTIPDPGLPDRRAYEMVSPPLKVGEVIPPEPSTQLGGSCGFCLPGENTPIMPMQSAPDGQSVLYLGQPFSVGLAAGPNEYVAGRAPSGWNTRSLSSPTITGVFEAFSDDLSRAVLFQAEPPLDPAAPLRAGEAFANLYLVHGDRLQPLITTEPPNRDPGSPSQAEAQRFRLVYGAANAGTALSPAFEHILFEANDALTAPVPGIAPASPEVNPGEVCGFAGADCNLYEWAGGELHLVNVLPGNTDATSHAVIGSGRLLASGVPQREAADLDHAISDDGSRIFWSSGETGHVYVRVGGQQTLEIPAPATCKESEPRLERACFLTASPDGASVLLSDGSIYRLNGSGSAYQQVDDLTQRQGGFQGILGAAEDLSRIYFVDTAALTQEAEQNANGEHAAAGEPNLYAWQEGDLDFIGTLVPDPGDDGEFGAGANFGAWKAAPSDRTAQVSADGDWLAFMSKARLTGYDNGQAAVGGKKGCSSSSNPQPGVPCFEVFVYSVDSGELTCASCNPSGQQPLGRSNLSLITPPGPFRQPANLSPAGDGRVFFESQDTLSPRDANGPIQDVYQWEPQSVGDCELPQGCVRLISSGQSPVDSIFLDSSATGDDAFFITREQLLPRDRDEQLDLYDARVGGGFTEAKEEGCSAEVSCRGSLPETREGPGPATPHFIGPGNQPPKKQCRKGTRRGASKQSSRGGVQQGGAAKQSQSDSSAQAAKPKQLSGASQPDFSATGAKTTPVHSGSSVQRVKRKHLLLRRHGRCAKKRHRKHRHRDVRHHARGGSR